MRYKISKNIYTFSWKICLVCWVTWVLYSFYISDQVDSKCYGLNYYLIYRNVMKLTVNQIIELLNWSISSRKRLKEDKYWNLILNLQHFNSRGHVGLLSINIETWFWISTNRGLSLNSTRWIYILGYWIKSIHFIPWE